MGSGEFNEPRITGFIYRFFIAYFITYLVCTLIYTELIIIKEYCIKFSKRKMKMQGFDSLDDLLWKTAPKSNE